MKLLGPKSQALLPPVPTATDASIRPEDVLLLQYAFSHLELGLYGAWFRAMVVAYGPGIPFLSLRHSILAFAAADLKKTFPSFETQSEFHTSRAVTVLIRKPNNPATIADVDLFAACVLSLKAYRSGGLMEEVLLHVNGCKAILRSWQDPKIRPDSKMLNIFGPLVGDISVTLTAHISISTLSTSTYPQVQRPFFYQERVKYWTELARLYSPPHPLMLSGRLLALQDRISFILKLIAHFIGRVALVSHYGHDERRRFAEIVLEYAVEELADHELRHELEELERTINVKKSGDVSAQFIFLLNHCIPLATALLDAPTPLLDSASDIHTNSRALHLISLCDPGLIRNLPNHFYHDYRLLLLLSALTLGSGQLEDRKYSDRL